MQNIVLHILPRQTMKWRKFIRSTPPGSIALDGIIDGGPRYDEATGHVNFDHHRGVLREATMSTAKQVLFAIKGGLMKHFLARYGTVHVYINDTDQDTALAVWLLESYILFEGTRSIPVINRLLDLTDKLDITGGAFPISASNKLKAEHNWIFAPYMELRKSGALASADEAVLRSNIESVLGRITDFMMGKGGQATLDLRSKLIYRSPFGYDVIEEIGGTDARLKHFAEGMDAFISIVARRDDGGIVYAVGKRSPYVPFPVLELYGVYNAIEPRDKSWNGSNLVGGSPRYAGSGLSPTELIKATDGFIGRKSA